MKSFVVGAMLLHSINAQTLSTVSASVVTVDTQTVSTSVATVDAPASVSTAGINAPSEAENLGLVAKFFPLLDLFQRVLQMLFLMKQLRRFPSVLAVHLGLTLVLA